ncbi:MAG TPA: ribosome recycling factor [Candidatus Babeliaceae bacterium]|nr:ribosome recycling factor [Candidatus Babeliaceae bacterium]
MVKFELIEGANTKPFEKAIEAEMEKPLRFFEKETAKIRTGRASTSLIEDIKVSCYGTVMALKDVAALSAPDVQLLVIQPWDKSIMADIEKAITASDLGITPINDGTVIRLQLPRMSGTRRDEFIKALHKKLEESKMAMRTARKDFHVLIRDAEKAKKISEDYGKRLQDILQKITDKYTDLCEKVSAKKEEELRSL